MFIAPFSMRDTDKPDLDLNFLTSVLDSRCTYLRTGVATEIVNGIVTDFAANVPRIQPTKGILCEPSRTNIFYPSENISSYGLGNASLVFDAAVVNPRGTTGAYRLQENTETTTHEVNKAASITGNTAYAQSVFVKGGLGRPNVFITSWDGFGGNFGSALIDLSTGAVLSGSATVTQCSNGWFRVSTVGTTNASATTGYLIVQPHNGTTTNYAGDGSSGVYVWGAQLEAGKTATSYIATTSATATRGGDDLRGPMGWFNSAQGTILVECLRPVNDTATNQRLWALRDSGAGSNSHSLRFNAADGSITALFFSNGTSGAVLVYAAANWTSDQIKRVVYGWAQDDVGFALGGLNPVVDASTPNGPPANIVRFFIGANSASGSESLNGYVRRVKCWSKKKSNATLQQLST